LLSGSACVLALLTGDKKTWPKWDLIKGKDLNSYKR
jgi:hypothetical protein